MGAMKRRLDIVNSPAGPDRFGRFASRISAFLGSRWGFLWAGIFVVAWALCGPFVHFSDTWQLIVNTGTGIVTFMMVFLLQNTQNRDARAINLKLDELIRAGDNARNHMINIEKLSDAELDILEEQFMRLRLKHQHEREHLGIAAD